MTMTSIPSVLSGYLKGSLPRDHEKTLKDTVKKNIAKEGIIHAIMHWGVGTKAQVDEYEDRAFSNLDEFKKQFQDIDIFSGTEMEILFILADKHGELNCVSSKVIKSYFESVIDIIKRHHYSYTWMSTLWGKWNLTMDDILRKSDGISKGRWKRMTLSKVLEEMAGKHYMGQDRNYVLAAKRYWLANVKESGFLQEEFSSSVFLTYNSADLDSLFPPHLPILHLHVIKGYRDEEDIKPWYV